MMVNRFGTTQDMIIQPVIENGKELLLAIDARGLYLTSENYIHRPIADPHRFSSRGDVSSRLEALNLDGRKLFEENMHMIKNVTEQKQKVNPLKASKRAQKRA